MRVRPCSLLAAVLVLAVCSESHGEERPSPTVEARSTLDQWLSAQNSGDFTQYHMLYGDGFRGVKRARNRTTSYDRNGWLRDRERMFLKDMVVEATDVRIVAKSQSAIVTFTQRWSSGRYSDIGPKQLILRRRADASGYQIVREELLASNVLVAGDVDVEGLKRFAFVIGDEVVISMSPPEDTWASGPPRFDGEREGLLLRLERPVSIEKLPPEIAQLQGMSVRLMDETGVKCEAKLGAFLLRGRFVQDTTFEDEPADMTWSSAGRFLVAKIDGYNAPCLGATWARAASLSQAPTAMADEASPELEALTWAAFAKLPGARAIQRRFDAWARRKRDRAKGPWFEAVGTGKHLRVIGADEGPKFLSVVVWRHEITGEPCDANPKDDADSVSATLWGLWEVTGPSDAPKLVLRNHPGESAVKVTGSTDVDGDGHPELLFESFTGAFAPESDSEVQKGIIRPVRGFYDIPEGPRTPEMICAC